ncbi:MAG TPA: hypothetical protein VHS06_03075, partial [Chloroflexota bacterium]|nr:hypothetical protein [Chloroflexota bacterium]
PFLIVRAGSVKRGAEVVVGGQSFQPYQELSITIKPSGDGKPLGLGTVTADKNGVVADSSLGLPQELGTGDYTVVATPTKGGASVEASLRVISDQTWTKLTADTAKTGGAVGYDGGGFAPGEIVSMHLDSLGTDAIGTVQATDQGTIAGAVRLPLAGEGSHTLLFYGDQTKTPAITDVSIVGFHPWVVLDNYSPGPEEQVGFAGSDFAPGETVYVFLNDLKSGPVDSVEVASDGSFKAPGALKLAAGMQGKQKLLFVGSQTQMASEADFQVLPYPGALQLTLYAGPPGSEVAFTGSGFSAGEEVTAYIGEPGNGTKVSTFKADAKGAFSGAGSFRIPRDTKAGDVSLSVAGQVSGTQPSVSFKVLSLSPWAEVKQDRSGMAVVVGHGFAVGEAVDLFVGGAGDKPVATAAADKDGNATFAPQEIRVESNKGAPVQLKGRDSGGEAKANYYGGGAPESTPAAGGQPPAGQPTSGAGNQSGGIEFRPDTTPGAATPVPTAGR